MPSHHSVSQVATATATDVSACTQMKRSICFAMSFRICTVMRLLLRVSICVTSFRLKESSSYKRKIVRNNTVTPCPRMPMDAQPSSPEHVRHAPGLLDLDARHARTPGRRRPCFGSRRVHRACGRLNTFDRRISLDLLLPPECPAKLLGARRHLHEHRVDLRPEEGGSGAERADETEHHRERAEQTRHVPSPQPVDDGIEHVEQHHAQHDGEEQRGGEAHHHDHAACGKDVQRRAAAPERPQWSITVDGGTGTGGGRFRPSLRNRSVHRQRLRNARASRAQAVRDAGRLDFAADLRCKLYTRRRRAAISFAVPAPGLSRALRARGCSCSRTRRCRHCPASIAAGPTSTASVSTFGSSTVTSTIR